MSKDVRIYLAHILESIDKIERFTAGGPADGEAAADPRQPKVLRGTIRTGSLAAAAYELGIGQTTVPRHHSRPGRLRVASIPLQFPDQSHILG